MAPALVQSSHTDLAHRTDSVATAEGLQATLAHKLSQSASRTMEFPIPRGPVTATLQFYAPPEDGSAPFNYVEQPPEGQPRSNYGTSSHTVTIHDIRNKESSYNLDKDAFAIVAGLPDSDEKDFLDDASIKENYYPEVEKLLLDNIPGSSKVVIFDHTIRRSGPNATRTPVLRAHIDQTARSAAHRVRLHVGPDEAEKFLQGRYRIINVWRPLNGPVVSSPLAFASSASVEDGDIVPADLRYPKWTGQTASVKYNEGQKWHYLSGMLNEERLLLECFDSEALKKGSNVHGGRVPHSAFVDSRTPAGAPGRESIEVRTLVFGP